MFQLGKYNLYDVGKISFFNILAPHRLGDILISCHSQPRFNLVCWKMLCCLLRFPTSEKWGTINYQEIVALQYLEEHIMIVVSVDLTITEKEYFFENCRIKKRTKLNSYKMSLQFFSTMKHMFPLMSASQWGTDTIPRQ